MDVMRITDFSMRFMEKTMKMICFFTENAGTHYAAPPRFVVESQAGDDDLFLIKLFHLCWFFSCFNIKISSF